MTAERLMLISGISAFLLTLFWVRSREIREKYALIWLLLSLALLLIGVFPDAVKSLAAACHLSYVALVLFFGLAFTYTFSFSVTVALTRQYRRNVRLAQECALLAERTRRLEGVLTIRPPNRPPDAGSSIADNCRVENDPTCSDQNQS